MSTLKRLHLALMLALAALAVVAASATAAEYWAFDIPVGDNKDTTLALSNSSPFTQTARIYNSAGLLTTYAIPPGGTSTHMLTGRPDDTTLTNTASFYINTTSSDVVATLFTSINPGGMNDASRLIREEELGILNYAFTHNEHASPIFPHKAFMTIVATQNATRVDVTPTAATRAGGTVPALAPGVTATFMLDRFDALNLHSEGDLTGSRILSSAPVALFSGHECTNVATSACDQLSDQIAPADFAGTDFVGCTTYDIREKGANIKDLYKIVSVFGAATVTVQPDGLTLALPGAGSSITFETINDVHITSTAPILVSVINKGDRDVGSANRDHASLVQLLPFNRYLPEHTLYVPTSWTKARVMVAAPAGTTYTVDGLPALPPPTWRSVASSGYSCTDSLLLPGTHFVDLTARAFVSVYAGEPNTSFWYRSDGDCLDFATGPSPPTALTASLIPGAPMNVRLDWGQVLDDGGCPVTKYHVHRGLIPGGSGAAIATVPRSTLTYNDTVPARCITFYYTVRAETRVGIGPPSNEVSHFHADLPGPARAPSIKVDLNKDQVTLRWTPPEDTGGCDPTLINIYRSTRSGIYAAPYATLGPDDLRFIDRLPDRCAPVYYRVTYVTRMGEGPPSDEVAYTSFPEDCNDPAPQPSADDSDADGVADGQDNCQHTANADQLDSDGDDIGDACDATPYTASPSSNATGSDGTHGTDGTDGFCTTLRLAENATASLSAPGIRITWSHPGDCRTLSFRVMLDDTRLIADVPLGPSPYEVTDIQYAAGPHFYWILTVPVDEPDAGVFKRALAVSTNEVNFGACELDPDGCLAEPDPNGAPAARDGAASSHTGAWVGSILGILAVIGGIFLLLFYRRRKQ